MSPALVGHGWEIRFQPHLLVSEYAELNAETRLLKELHDHVQISCSEWIPLHSSKSENSPIDYHFMAEPYYWAGDLSQSTDLDMLKILNWRVEPPGNLLLNLSRLLRSDPPRLTRLTPISLKFLNM